MCDVPAEPLQWSKWAGEPLSSRSATLILAACGSGQAAAPPVPASTVGDVGALPGELSSPDSAGTVPATFADATTSADPTTTEQTPSRRTTTTSSTDPDRPGSRPATQPVGRIAEGNRVLMIGDSILAATAERYAGEMCDRLVPMGWAVEVDARPVAPSSSAARLDRRLDAGWDAVVILLGTNYNGNAPAFADALGEMLDELEPIPVLLLTVSEYEERQAEVNYVIRTLGRQHDNVRVLEWSERTADDDSLLRGDGIHPSDEGRQVLVSMISQALGRAPLNGDIADCLPTRFTNDSGS